MSLVRHLEVTLKNVGHGGASFRTQLVLVTDFFVPDGVLSALPLVLVVAVPLGHAESRGLGRGYLLSMVAAFYWVYTASTSLRVLGHLTNIGVCLVASLELRRPRVLSITNVSLLSALFLDTHGHFLGQSSTSVTLTV